MPNFTPFIVHHFLLERCIHMRQKIIYVILLATTLLLTIFLSTCCAAKKEIDPTTDPDLISIREITQYIDSIYTLHYGMTEEDFLANFTNAPGWYDYDTGKPVDSSISMRSVFYNKPSVNYYISRKRDSVYEDLNITFNNNSLELPTITLATNDPTIYTKSIKYAVRAYTSRLGNPKLKYIRNRADAIPTYAYKWYTEKQILYMLASNQPEKTSVVPHKCQYAICIQIVDKRCPNWELYETLDKTANYYLHAQ